MRVGLVIYGSLNSLSGGYLYDRMLVRQLLAGGHHVEVISTPWRNYARHLGDNGSNSWQRRLAAIDVDVLIQDELNHPSLLLANRRRRSFPVISLVHHLRSSETHHPPLLSMLYRQLESFYVNSVDALLYNSRTTQRSVDQLLRHVRPYCVAYPAADHLPVQEPAVDIDRLAARSRQDGPLRILFVGNLIPRKGLHTVLDALTMLAPSSWQLSVVGRTDVDVDYTKKITQKVRSLPADALIFCGRLSDEQLVVQYRSHHLFVLPSYEGFGIACLEAMRFGLPVLAATAGAAREIVTVGADGFLVDPRDSVDLAQHVVHLGDNREQLLAMGYAARQRYVRHPTWHQSMAEATAWLASLL